MTVSNKPLEDDRLVKQLRHCASRPLRNLETFPIICEQAATRIEYLEAALAHAPQVEPLKFLDRADDEAIAWITSNLTALLRDNGSMEYNLTAVVRAYQAGRAALAHDEQAEPVGGKDKAEIDIEATADNIARHLAAEHKSFGPTGRIHGDTYSAAKAGARMGLETALSAPVPEQAVDDPFRTALSDFPVGKLLNALAEIAALRWSGGDDPLEDACNIADKVLAAPFAERASVPDLQVWGWVIPRGGKKKPIILSAETHGEESAAAEADIHDLGYFPLLTASPRSAS